MEREVGGGIGMGNTCKPMAVSFQCMTKFTTNKKKIKKKKKQLLSQSKLRVYFEGRNPECLLCVFLLLTQLCLTLCDPMDCSSPGSSVCVILQARVRECTAIPFSRGSSQPRDQIQGSHMAGRFFTV